MIHKFSFLLKNLIFHSKKYAFHYLLFCISTKILDFGLSKIIHHKEFVVEGKDIRRHDLGRLAHMLIEIANLNTFLNFFGFMTDDV